MDLDLNVRILAGKRLPAKQVIYRHEKICGDTMSCM